MGPTRPPHGTRKSRLATLPSTILCVTREPLPFSRAVHHASARGTRTRTLKLHPKPGLGAKPGQTNIIPDLFINEHCPPPPPPQKVPTKAIGP